MNGVLDPEELQPWRLAHRAIAFSAALELCAEMGRIGGTRVLERFRGLDRRSDAVSGSPVAPVTRPGPPRAQPETCTLAANEVVGVLERVPRGPRRLPHRAASSSKPPAGLYFTNGGAPNPRLQRTRAARLQLSPQPLGHTRKHSWF
jgi:hypothetical protein